MKKIFTLLLCLTLSFSAFAQLKKIRLGNNSNQHISLGVGASYPVFDLPGNIGGAANLSYTYYFMPQLGLRGEASYAYLRYNNGVDDAQYQITKSDIDNFTDYASIAKELDIEHQNLHNILGF